MKRLLLIFILAASLWAQSGKESRDFSYALKLYEQEFFDLAAGQFVNFYKYFPNSAQAPEARYYAGMSFFKRKLYEKARVEFQALALQYPKSKRAAEGWFKAGKCNLLLDDRDEALKAFETIRLLYAKSPFAVSGLFEAGKIHLAQNKAGKAWQNFSVIIDRYKDSPLYYKALVKGAHSLVLLNEPEQAKNLVRQVLDSQADAQTKASAYLQLALIQKQQGYLSESAKNFDTIINKFSTSDVFGRAVLEISRSFLLQKKYDQVRKYLNKGLDIKGKPLLLAEMHGLLGDVDFHEGKYALAFEAYAQAKEKVSDSLRVVFSLKQALCSKKQDMPDKALSILESELSLYPYKKSPVYTEAHAIYISWLEAAGYYDKVLALLMERVKGDEQSSFEQVLHVARIMAKLERWRDLIQLLQPYTFSQKKFPEKDDVFYFLALANEKLERYDESAYLYGKLINDFAASDFYERAVSRLRYLNDFRIVQKDVAVNKLADVLAGQIAGAEKGELFFELGRVYFENIKDYKKAENNFKRALSDSSADIAGDVFFYLGKTYLKLAQEDTETDRYSAQAEKYLKKAAVVEAGSNFSDQASWLLLESLLQKSKIPVEKEKSYLEALIRKFPQSALKEKWYSSLAVTLAYDSSYVHDSIKYFKILIRDFRHSASYPRYLFGYAKLLKDTDREEAVKVFKELALSYSFAHEAAAALYEVAAYYEQNKQFAEANTLYSKLAGQYYYCDLAAEINSNRGLILAKAGKYDLAVPELERELDSPFIHDYILSANFLSEQRYEKIFYLAGAYSAGNKLNKAAGMYRLFLTLAANSPLSDRARFELASIYYNSGRRAMALENFLAVSKNETAVYFRAQKYAAEIYFENGSYEAAASIFQNLAKLSKEENEQRYLKERYIVTLIRLGNIKEARAAINKFKKSYSGVKNQLALFTVEMGNYYRVNKNFNKARKMFEQVKKKYARSEYADDADYFLAVTYVTLNKVEEAFKILSSFYNHYQNSNRLSAALNTLGNIYFRSEKYDNAIAMFKNALKYNKEQTLKANIMSNLIKTYALTGFWDAAQATAREYVKEFPYAADRLDKEIVIARAYINLNQFQNAVEYLKEIKLRADAEREPEIQFYIGEALLKAGQYENAIAEFVKIPLLSKKTKLQWEASALYYSGQSYEKLGRTEEAIRMYKEIIRRPGIDLVLKKDAQKRIKQIQ